LTDSNEPPEESARAIREEKNTEAVVTEIIEAAVRGRRP
jgi:hypothetical protein